MFDVLTHLESINGVASCLKGNKQSITATNFVIEQLQQNSSILQKAISKPNRKRCKENNQYYCTLSSVDKLKHPVWFLPKSSSETKVIGDYQALWQLHSIHHIVIQMIQKIQLVLSFISHYI